MKVAVVGLGLIGGSLAKSTKVRTAHTVYGIDLDADTMMMARMCGAIDGELTPDNLPACELVFLALRPGAALPAPLPNSDLLHSSLFGRESPQ